MKEFVVLGLGSNKGWNGMSPLSLLRSACRRLSSFLSDFSYSSVYLTEPMYVKDQEKFFNMVVSGFISDCEPEELLERIHLIEAALGRDRNKEVRNGPRSIDIDIELFGERTVSTPTLVIPHPRILERSFVLVPMVEILEERADSKRYEEVFSAAESIGTRGVKKILRF